MIINQIMSLTLAAPGAICVGGTRTNAIYQASGTISQADAGSMSGGPFSLEGGFWGIIAALRTPGSSAAILNTGTNPVLISWPSPSAGFQLEKNADLTTTNSSRVELNVADDGTTKSVIVAPAAGSRFFRLKWP
jgi:hypothetical protein